MRFDKQLRYQNQTRRYLIAMTSSGWEVREEQNSEVVRQEHYRDWHRVERARWFMTIELDALQQKGWQEEH